MPGPVKRVVPAQAAQQTGKPGGAAGDDKSATLHKRHQPKKNRRYAFPFKLFLPFSLHQLPTARTEAQDKLLILDVPAHTVEPCCIGSPRFLFQNKGRICAPRQPCCSRYLVEHIAVVLLADMVDNYHCKGMSCPQTP